MIESLLIANRGEIACRIIRTCRRLGIRSIAVFSDADRDARHVQEADEAVRIGPAEAAKSYLDPAAIMAAAAQSNAAAIHPGYGFLSEKPVLARLCEEQRRIWVGPRADVIERMGSKTAAKKLAAAAGVTLVPGYHGDDQGPAHLAEQASRIGFPVLIKASAGGGGRGMRRVDRAEDFLAQLTLARQEAARAFGDDRMLLERLIPRPRHVEVQLAGDRHGHVIHLLERECSIQRRYQKVIEEAPAAFLPERTLQKLYDHAVKLGQAIRYDSLGTVEFVLEAEGDEPYFLEMNTRLQVEHPVTEAITGLDLVELQLRIADGEPLPLSQSDVKARGWAIEARINCENPAADYRPELGTILEVDIPERADLRVDSGVAVGTTVSPYYDSMIAKIIGSGATRAAAVRSVCAGIDGFETLGVGTNQQLVRDLLANPHFLDRPLTTGFIEEQLPAGWSPDATVRTAALAVAAFCELHGWRAPAPTPIASASPWQSGSSFRNVSKTGQHGWARFVITVDGERAPVWLTRRRDAWQARIADTTVDLALAFDGSTHVRARTGDAAEARFGFFRDASGHTFVSHHGMRFDVTIVSDLEDRASAASDHADGSGAVIASLPGLITAVHVAVGQTVARGDVVVVMESMKLMFSMQAPIAGQVAAVLCSTGQTVANAQTLVEIVAELPGR